MWIFFFFKQKTSYELRISDWSSDVCSSDLKSFRISLVRRFGVRSSARAEYDSSNDRVRLGYQSSGGYGVGAWSGSANVDIGPDTRSLNANGSYVANRADLSLAHTTAYSTQTDSNKIGIATCRDRVCQ